MLVRLLLTDVKNSSEPRKVRLDGEGIFTIGSLSDNILSVPIKGISRRHAELRIDGNEIIFEDLSSANGSTLDGQEITACTLEENDEITLAGRVKLEILEIRRPAKIDLGKSSQSKGEVAPRSKAADGKTFVFSGNSEPSLSSVGPVNVNPIVELFKNPLVEVAEILSLGVSVEETGYIVVGGGLGSFTFVDHLRVFGLDSKYIRVVGGNRSPYDNYKRYCTNSQLPNHERLRSNSISTPDNIWGFPGYASRESWTHLKKGKLGSLKHMLTVFNEPSLAISYTPTAQQVFDSIDKEADRIGWTEMLRHGRAQYLRKTLDGRYALLYRDVDAGGAFRVLVGAFVHIATGYPSVRFLDDLREFKGRNPESRGLVINAYDPHEYAYQELREVGAKTVVVRGRGIVASRIIQKLNEIRKTNPQLVVVQILRSKRQYGTGAKYERARRPVYNDVEIQPFNWPKACWGGSLRKKIEEMDDLERAKTLAVLGGTTTAERSDWRELIEDGRQEGWYKKYYGAVTSIVGLREARKVRISLKLSEELSENRQIDCDYVLDCTGLIADINRSPFLNDLISTYRLQQNNVSTDASKAKLGGFKVTPAFEIDALRHGSGRVYAAGQLVAGGPYAAVDSFLGLQYAALRSVRDLTENPDSQIDTFGPMKSLNQWFKWTVSRRP